MISEDIKCICTQRLNWLMKPHISGNHIFIFVSCYVINFVSPKIYVTETICQGHPQVYKSSIHIPKYILPFLVKKGPEIN